MLTKVITLIALTGAINGSILDHEVHNEKLKMDRNNIINKGIWIRNKHSGNLFNKKRIGDFIFRDNSLDVENTLMNHFGVNYREDEPGVANYFQRAKRAIRHIRAQRLGKNLKNCIGKECKTLEQENEEQSKDAVKRDDSDEKNTPLVNEYPKMSTLGYEVATSLNNNKKAAHTLNNETQHFENEINNSSKINDIVSTTIHSKETDYRKNNSQFHKNPTNINSQRSKKYDFESEIIKKFEMTEDMNTSHENNEENRNKITDRNIFDKDNIWHQNAPIPNVNVYKVVPKEPQKSKAVTERGLIKVISMLTKTFKRIIKQHNEIKKIHEIILNVNDRFVKNTGAIATKFQDFDVKYLYMLKFYEKLKSFELKLATKQEYFQNKERQMSNNFKEFEAQQKKFLQQQRQFYNIQKMMLAQNEKVNMKQNAIAKTQSEISHRQNNFARILKKTKQLYLESRNPISKLSSNLIKTIQHPNSATQNAKITTTTPSTESVKINLFSIPTSNKIQQNQDELIIKEKDDQTIDDLVYKYYFNNTFIDNIMKNNVLTSFMGVTNHPGIPRNVKSKRNELETTILLPVFENNDSEAIVSKNRERRWINHHSRHRSKRRHRGKGEVATINDATDAKIGKKVVNNIGVDGTAKSKDEGNIKIKYDPFLAMAMKFCNEIRQNTTVQTLQWCVVKALRRLRFLDTDHLQQIPKKTEILPMPDVRDTTENQWKPNKLKQHTKTKTLSFEMSNEPITEPNAEPTTEPQQNTIKTKLPTSTTGTDTPSTKTQLPSAQVNTTLAPETQPEIASSISEAALFFPDNEMLESKLQEFDEKPDTEGNVYFEGSVHASDILDSESQGMDDFMPGMESNSKIEMDPLAYDLQAQRRAIVRKLNKKIKMSLGKKK